MDVLRKELTGIYAAQCLDDEALDSAVAARCREALLTCAGTDGDCRVLTDASADLCTVVGGRFAYLIGLSDSAESNYCRDFSSSDEDEIYNRIHPEDLVDKRMLEYEFFKFVDPLPGGEKLRYKATCNFRIKDRNRRYIRVDNSTQILRTSPRGKIWLILCCYDLSSDQSDAEGISPRILNNATGEVTREILADCRANILTDREKEVLRLIRDGYASKRIADELGISIHTVNRHRQNILEKLSVGNSIEAVRAALAMKLL